jgi:hypothetical protein
MTTYSREIEIERADVDTATGEIGSLPVFTGGNATDGHILNMKGVQIKGDVPWFVQHEADPRDQLGTLTNPRVEGDALVFDGEILAEGTGEKADIRRDLLLKIARGHVKRLSGRWDAEPRHVRRRVDLPKDHPARVDKDAEGPERYGLYFEKWTPMEGSLVGLGADPAAVMRWAQDEDSAESVRAFWRSQVPEESEPVVEIEMELEDEGTDEPSGPDPLEEILARLDSLDGRLSAIESPAEEENQEREEVQPDPLPAQEPERVEADPLSALKNLDPVTLAKVRLRQRANESIDSVTMAKVLVSQRDDGPSLADRIRKLREDIAADREEGNARFLQEIERLRGKVTT